MLEIHDLKVSHGPVNAIRGVSLNVEPGETVALIGANGAGKSTLLEAISGIKRPVKGRIWFDGERIETLPSHVVMAKGIAHVPENRLIFSRLTVEENLLAAAPAKMSMTQARKQRDSVLECVPQIAGRLHETASVLSGGQQQLLAIVRGLMSAPRLLLLDEPTLGLSPIATASIFELLAKLAIDDLSVVVIDQNVRAALSISRRAYLIDNGEIVLSGTAAALLEDERIADVFLGGSNDQGRKPI